MRTWLRCALPTLFVFMLASSSRAQVTAPYLENFDAGALPAGWTVTVIAGTGVVTWGVDATPATVTGANPSTFGGSASSLNYNDGVDTFDTADATLTPPHGTAQSPDIDVTALAGSIVVSFQCAYEMEFVAGSTFFDARTMEVQNSAGVSLKTYLFDEAGAPSSDPPATDCPGAGPFHGHVLDASAFVGAVSPIRIMYRFNRDNFGWGAGSGFGVSTGFTGWFIENLSVNCADAIPPSTPTNLTPAAGSFQISPPGITLSWTAATDATSCGVGTIANYVVEVGPTNPPVFPFTFTATPTGTSVTTGALLPGQYFFHVRAVDALGNVGMNSTATDFFVELPAPPSPPDTLFVNEQQDGAQSGDGGFVDPVIDEFPVFSAIYRDANTVDNADAFHWQVSDDLFATVLFDSGVVSLLPVLPKDTRLPDQAIPIQLNRDTVYSWRIQFRDSSGLTGAFSVPQQFRIGDDFDFGVRPGSTNHSRRCFVATAAHGSVSPGVSSLMQARTAWIEKSGTGLVFSGAYAAVGPAVSRGVDADGRSGAAARGLLLPLELAAASHEGLAVLMLVVSAFLASVALRRLR